MLARLPCIGAAYEGTLSEAAVGGYLADQLMVPLALAGSGDYTAQKLTQHAPTNIAVIQKFVDVEFDFGRTAPLHQPWRMT